MPLIADIFITMRVCRSGITAHSFNSFLNSGARDDCRLTCIVDGGDEDEAGQNLVERGIQLLEPDNLVIHRGTSRGLGPSINEALAIIDAMKRWDSVAVPFTCYLQDDITYTPGWLQKLSTMFIINEDRHNLGFATGVTCPEHQKTIRDKIDGVGVLQDWIRATCMFARHDYWMSMWPVSRIDPETGRERARPHGGMGSSVDWWFIRNHENSVCKKGKTNLVMPGLLQHLGCKSSSWLDKELPETEEDKQKIEESLPTEELRKKWRDA